jgi:hypothetical protein
MFLSKILSKLNDLDHIHSLESIESYHFALLMPKTYAGSTSAVIITLPKWRAKMLNLPMSIQTDDLSHK